jgi:membrane-bound lytic murein transglycosylase A
MQFTGYYNPVYHAKLHRDAVYRYPLYRLPQNPMLQTLSREEITRGGLSGKGLELAWLSNPVDPFMLQVQGSGAILLDSGEGVEIRQIINYAGQNGKPYVSLGKLMRAAGISEEYISLQGIKKYFLEVHPEDWEKFSNQNPSFVFFKKDENGPYGYSGAVLTPKHSIAVDKTVFPMGAIGLLETERPSRLTGQEPQEWKKFTQFVVAQDTGGAIRSPGRVDTFWGEGNYAEATAGHLDRGGSLYFVLVPESRTR